MNSEKVMGTEKEFMAGVGRSDGGNGLHTGQLGG